MSWVLLSGLGGLAAYVLFAGALVLAGRREAARAVAGFLPDCLVLVRRLSRDARVGRSVKLLLAVVVGYLAIPFDVVPDFIPVAGQLDDAVVVALALRAVLRSAGPGIVREHWPGPAASLALMLRLSAP